jgi:hypothetical protein
MISLMMEAASTSETTVNFFQTTQRNIQDNSHLHTRRRENLKSHIQKNCLHWRIRSVCCGRKLQWQLIAATHVSLLPIHVWHCVKSVTISRMINNKNIHMKWESIQIPSHDCVIFCAFRHL